MCICIYVYIYEIVAEFQRTVNLAGRGDLVGFNTLSFLMAIPRAEEMLIIRPNEWGPRLCNIKLPSPGNVVIKVFSLRYKMI